ncbi:hypothetical protein EK21DRAFT_118843 [Setomelanomma holmii]|uniref:Uncharacterized protein n=1 Tax=Setomelanomma holmii TaxID=210430 RepID=A0A9P4LGN4_9PLEO|nr:hypothetical protein EK21DRAFT_118843 [Setomelanomma holmii]
MKLTLLALTSLLTLTLATPTPLSKRDKFDKCSVFGSNCATQDQSFCDSDTGKISVCHKFGSDCWIRYTQDACAAKREVTFEKRDEFNKCSVFGADCAVDGNEFCRNGIKAVCQQVGFGSGECWVRYTAETC